MRIKKENLKIENIKSLKNGFYYNIDYKNASLLYKNDNIYILSYQTCILQIDLKNGVFYENINKYSITTSKQKSQIKSALFTLNPELKFFEVIEKKPKHQLNGYYYNLFLLELAGVNDGK